MQQQKWWLTVNDIHLMQMGEIVEADIEATVIEEAPRWQRNARRRERYRERQQALSATIKLPKVPRWC